MNKLFRRSFVGALIAGAVSIVNAAAVNVTDVTADIAAQSAPIAAVAGAVLVLIVGIKAFKWVRRAM